MARPFNQFQYRQADVGKKFIFVSIESLNWYSFWILEYKMKQAQDTLAQTSFLRIIKLTEPNLT